MVNTQLKTPVLFIIFNRIDTAAQVFQAIAEAKPEHLYLFSDGARAHIAGEKEKCEEVRQTLLSRVSWPCRLHTRFLEKNLGPRLAIGNAISWMFETQEEGIILEHDCLPSQSFFRFCEELLTYYRHDERIMHISGDNFQYGRLSNDSTYYFSLLNHIWGFATWRRAWRHYDVEMSKFPAFKEEGLLENIIQDKRVRAFWEDTLERTYDKQIQTWDYQWTFAMWCQHGLAVLPNHNLVSNVGFDSQALNTTNPEHKLANIPRVELGEIKHPPFMIVNHEADNRSMDEVFYPTLKHLVLNKINKTLNLK